MKVVVNIPNWLYNAIMECKEPQHSQSLGDAVRDGMPLPKGHGDLIDRRELKEHLYACETNGRPLYVMELHERLAVIDEVDAIIEADKGGKQE